MSATIFAARSISKKIYKRFKNIIDIKTAKKGLLLINTIIKLIQLIIGLLLILPVACVFPKQRNLILFIGNGDGQFRDNVKYLYLQFYRSKPEDLDFYFLTENHDVYQKLADKQLPVLVYPRLLTFYKMLRASNIVVDNFAWIKRAKYHFLLKAHKTQLWHGCSIKMLELDNPLLRPSPHAIFRRILYFVAGRFPTYDLFLSTSKANTENIFQHAFKYKKIIESGYPRNDVLFSEPEELELIGSDTATIAEVQKLKNNHCKAVLYAPTFRDTGTGNDFLEKDALDMQRLSDFACKHKIIVVFKIHPNRQFRFNIDATPNILHYQDTGDIYPLLSFIDVLVTDYSSLFFDFLYLNRPIVFYPYDYEKYIQHDRKLKYDYNWVTPGPKCLNQDELQSMITRVLFENEDTYQQRRQEIFDMSFSHKEGNAALYIMKKIQKEVSENYGI
jgi:CDP-glycerol glycerophosphotransferase